MQEDYECGLCDSLVVTDITLDLAYIEMSGQIFANAVDTKDYDRAQAVVSNLLFSANVLSKYAVHKAHQ